MSKTLCFTGHRPAGLYGYDESTRLKYAIIVNQLLDICEDLYDKGFHKFISGGAQGVDQLAFWAVNRLREDGRPDVENAVYVPCIEQWRPWRQTGLFGQGEYMRMLELATETVYVSEKSYRGPQDMIRRNHVMVDNSDAVLAVYGKDEDWHDAKGGTAECMRYAEKLERPIIIFNPFTNEISYENWAALVRAMLEEFAETGVDRRFVELKHSVIDGRPYPLRHGSLYDNIVGRGE